MKKEKREIICPLCNKVAGRKLSDLHDHFLLMHEAPQSSDLFFKMLRDDHGIERMSTLFRVWK
jgi:hypothetical protein